MQKVPASRMEFDCCGPVSYTHLLIKADGFPKKAIKTSLAGAATNIILDALFVLVFHWGITGAAVATGLSQVLTFTVYLRHFLSDRSGFSFVKIRWSAKAAASLAKLGTADCVTELSVGVCIFVFNPVSYTHLDVYKRQVVHDMPREKAREFVRELKDFHMAGWQKIMNM